MENKAINETKIKLNVDSIGKNRCAVPFLCEKKRTNNINNNFNLKLVANYIIIDVVKLITHMKGSKLS